MPTVFQSLVIAQVLAGLAMTGLHVLRGSELRLLLDRSLTREDVLLRLRGTEPRIVSLLGGLPPHSRVLVVSRGSPWFLNYYLLPRRAFRYPGIETEADLASLDRERVRRDRIEAIILYDPKESKVWRVEQP